MNIQPPEHADDVERLTSLRTKGLVIGINDTITETLERARESQNEHGTATARLLTHHYILEAYSKYTPGLPERSVSRVTSPSPTSWPN